MVRRTDEGGVSRIMSAVFSTIVVVCFFLPWKAVFGQSAAGYEIAYAAARLMDSAPGRGLVLLALAVVPLGCHAANTVIQVVQGPTPPSLWLVTAPPVLWLAVFVWALAGTRSPYFTAAMLPSEVGGIGTGLAMVLAWVAAWSARLSEEAEAARGRP